MIRKQWFTILELILVLGVLSTLIVMSKSMFTNPNNDVLQSEVCINQISTQIEWFLNNAITGKWYLNGIVNPTTYTIKVLHTDSTRWNSINLYTDGNSTSDTNGELDDVFPSTWSYNVFENFWSPDRSAIIANDCQNKKFVILLSSIPTYSSDLDSHELEEGPIKTPPPKGLPPKGFPPTNELPTIDIITINKNLESSSDNPGWISLCNWEFPCTWTDDPIIAYTLTYRVCSNYNENTQIGDNNCIHTYSNRIDLATQSVKSNKCLGIDRNNNVCNKRSIDDF